jgi:hypothetical protein
MSGNRIVLIILLVAIAVFVGVQFSGYGDCCVLDLK